MSSNSNAIIVEGLGKCYHIYNQPQDRLKQFIVPRLHRLVGKQHKNYFHEFWALQEISFKIKSGESIGVIGRNGSGKSTLLQLICGTLTPTSGTVMTNGRVAALLELGSGFNPEFTGRENVYLNAAVLGLNKREIDNRFADIAAFADIGEFIEQPVKTYSSGMMVRLAFAVIAHVNADILVIDEALAVGDAFFAQKCMRFMRTFMKTGTVLFVSHDTAAVQNLCNRAIWIEKGRIVNDGNAKEVCEKYLQAYYESMQGKSSMARFKTNKSQDGNDGQLHQIQNTDASNLRNNVKVFKFDLEAESFGKGNAQITGVEFLDKNLSPLNWIVGGEQVTIRIRAIAHETLNKPILGFFIKDRLGQILFGDNTYLSYIESTPFCVSGNKIVAEFTFCMPFLPNGNYSVAAAIANGTLEEHVQHHWIHDALIFKSEASNVTAGLVGIPMQNIKLYLSDDG